MKEPSWKEVKQVVMKARSSSAPGPNGIPYKVYKKCPLLLKRLWSLLRVVWKKGSARHILSGCQTALSQGRYRWRHDQVLGELAHTLEKESKKPRPHQKNSQYTNFVREGEKSKRLPKGPVSILDESCCWEMRVYLKGKLQFPEEIAHTSLCPDIVIWSRRPKLAILIELTLPWEEKIEESHKLKR